MSWLAGLAEKAEDLLNKIDSETASVLSKEQIKSTKIQIEKDSCQEGFISFHPIPSSSSVPSNLGGYCDTRSNRSSSIRGVESLNSSPHRTANNNYTNRSDKDKYLLDMLNNSQNTKAANNGNLASTDLTHSRHSSLSSASSFLAVSGTETPGFTEMESSGGSGSTDQYVSLDKPIDVADSCGHSYSESLAHNESDGSNSSNRDDINRSEEAQLQKDKECSMLRKEVSSLNQEMTQVLRRAKCAEKESQHIKMQLSSLSNQLKESSSIIQESHQREEKLQDSLKSRDLHITHQTNEIQIVMAKLKEREASVKEMQEQNQRLLAGATLTNDLHSDAVTSLQEKVKDLDSQLDKEKERHTTSQQEFTARLNQTEDESKALSIELSETQKKTQGEKSRNASLNSQLSSLKCELSSVKEELSEYKEKACRILQSKDRLIAYLKEGTDGGHSRDGSDLLQEEMENLRSEKDFLLEEVEKYSEKLKLMNVELSECEAQAQQEASSTAQQLLRLQEDFHTQRSDAAFNQEELRQSQQELRITKEELTRQKVVISTRLQERDTEVERLQKQIAHKQSSSSSVTELEARIHGLTESLIHKQTSIEALSTDKHSLQIQLEKLQQQYHESQQHLNIDPVNETAQDDVRNRVPTFLVESPFDGGVTRRVKKAYGTLDKFSIRSGVFLRRYPIARVFVLLYMGLLHVWVMVVLFTYSPEIHGPNFIHDEQSVAVFGSNNGP